MIILTNIAHTLRTCTHTGDVKVFEGHAFIVEAAVSVGGRDMKPGLNIYRCAPACACAGA